MSFWSKLFGADKIIDAGIKGIDAMVFTDEEKSKAKMSLLKLYEPYKLAQRYLAMIYSIPYALAWLITFISSFWLNVDVQREMLLGEAFYINITILSFYFGGGLLEGVVSKLKK